MDKDTYWKIIWIIAIVSIVANLFDCVTTFIALQHKHIEETTIFMRFLFENYPPLVGYLLKIIVGTWIFLPLKFCPLYCLIKNKRKFMNWTGIAIMIIATLRFIIAGVTNIIEMI